MRSAIGFNEGRGDKVEVINLEFAEKPVDKSIEIPEDGTLTFTKYDYFRIAELGVMAILTLLVLLVVVRPLLRRVLDNTPPPEAVSAMDGAYQESGASGPDNSYISAMMSDNPAAKQIAEAKRLGNIRAEVVQQIGSMVNESPDAATEVVRNLIAEAA